MARLISKKTSRGDTIIEVLISIAIVGLVIAAAYALASRSLQQGITASERTEALKLAEGQIEALKFRQQRSSATVWTNEFTDASNFCLNPEAVDPSDDDSWLPIQNEIQTIDEAENLTRSDPPGTPGYNETCNSDIASNAKYFINITIRDPDELPPGSPLITNPTYLVAIRWNAIGGGQNQSQLYYRF